MERGGQKLNLRFGSLDLAGEDVVALVALHHLLDRAVVDLFLQVSNGAALRLRKLGCLLALCLRFEETWILHKLHDLKKTGLLRFVVKDDQNVLGDDVFYELNQFDFEVGVAQSMLVNQNVLGHGGVVFIDLKL